MVTATADESDTAGSPMPFGCVAFEAVMPQSEVFDAVAASPMPFGCVAFEAVLRTPKRN